MVTLSELLLPRRIYLPRTPVNRGKTKSGGFARILSTWTNDVALGKEQCKGQYNDDGRVCRPDTASPCPACGPRRAACRGSEARVCGPGRDDLRRPRRPGDAVGVAFGRGYPGHRLGAELGSALYGHPGRTRGAIRTAGNGDRLRGPRLLLALPAAAPGARGAAEVGCRALLLLCAALHGLDGGARDGAGPDPPLRLLGPHCHRLLLPHRLRPPQGGVASFGADGAPRHWDHGGAAPDRGALPLRRLWDLLRPGTRRSSRARTAPDRLRPPHRSRGAREERAGPLPLLATARDGRPDAGFRLPTLGGDGRRGGLADRAGLPAPPEERRPARRATGLRAPLDGGRRPLSRRPSCGGTSRSRWCSRRRASCWR